MQKKTRQENAMARRLKNIEKYKKILGDKNLLEKSNMSEEVIKRKLKAAEQEVETLKSRVSG